MKIGMIGLGKLGTPVAVALAMKYEVIGYDVNPQLMKKCVWPHKELGPTLKDDFQKYFDSANLTYAPIDELIKKCDIIFVCVQTPHHPMYEGTVRVPADKKDFDYTFLKEVATTISKHVTKDKLIVIISTVLPGTIRRDIAPILEDKCGLVYNPAFPAMGTAVSDFVNPEFVLLGSNNPEALKKIREFYADFYGKDMSACMSIESAELCKVYYNTVITNKIVLANTLMEMCHKVPNCNCDDITNAISRATNRIISPRYLRGGMGDSGGCHPRDLIAMSWLSKKLDISYDLYNNLSIARESQSEWLVKLMIKHGQGLPKVILGKSFKPESNITTGSCAILCSNIITNEYGFKCEMWDPFIDQTEFNFGPSVFLIGTKHMCFKDITFPAGSVIIDPHRYIDKKDNITVIHVGIGEKCQEHGK